MNKIAKTYLMEKLTRTEIKDAAIKVLRSKEGIYVEIGGRGVELIEIIAYLVGLLSKMSGVPFEIMTEMLKAEHECTNEEKEEGVEKESHDREDINKLFNDVFKELNL
ncbi:MAG: hypothetical protein IKQ00_00155 [Butyrivibrio sp.]|nr:hypothetical protein [Butyrivibrio sp.]